MSIEFACPECDSYLRTAEEKAGLRIRCPACEEPIWVPYRDQNPVGVGTSESLQETSPAATWQQERSTSAGEPVLKNISIATAGSPPVVTLRAILSQTWQVYVENFAQCMLASAVDLLATLVGAVVSLIMGGVTLVILHGFHDFAIMAAVCVWLLGMTVVYSAISVGNFRYYLALARGTPIAPRLLMVRESAVGSMIVAWIFFWTIACLGLLMCVIPGLLAMAFLWPFAAIIVDRNASAPRALREAMLITSRNPRVSIWVFLLHLALLAAATLPLLGQFVALPLAAVLHSVSYLHLAGEMPPRGLSVQTVSGA